MSATQGISQSKHLVLFGNVRQPPQEIFKLICSFLDAPSISAAMRVNQTWKAIVFEVVKNNETKRAQEFEKSFLASALFDANSMQNAKNLKEIAKCFHALRNSTLPKLQEDTALIKFFQTPNIPVLFQHLDYDIRIEQAKFLSDTIPANKCARSVAFSKIIKELLKEKWYKKSISLSSEIPSEMHRIIVLQEIASMCPRSCCFEVKNKIMKMDWKGKSTLLVDIVKGLYNMRLRFENRWPDFLGAIVEDRISWDLDSCCELIKLMCDEKGRPFLGIGRDIKKIICVLMECQRTETAILFASLMEDYHEIYTVIVKKLLKLGRFDEAVRVARSISNNLPRNKTEVYYTLAKIIMFDYERFQEALGFTLAIPDNGRKYGLLQCFALSYRHIEGFNLTTTLLAKGEIALAFKIWKES